MLQRPVDVHDTHQALFDLFAAYHGFDPRELFPRFAAVDPKSYILDDAVSDITRQLDRETRALLQTACQAVCP